MSVLSHDIKFVAGVGEVRARLLEREVGVRTIGDLIYRFPYRYIDRTRVWRIDEVDESLESTYVQLRVRIVGFAYSGELRKRRFIVEASDASGTCELIWFQGIKWIERRLEVGREYLIFGRPSFFRNRLSIIHPDIEPIEQALSRKQESGFQGIYASTERLAEGISAKAMYNIVLNAWHLIAADPTAIVEPLPEDMRRRNGLMSLSEALYNIHFPQSADKLRAAQYRLKYDELLGVQLTIQARRTARKARGDGFIFPRVGEAFNTFYRTKLPFSLTAAQQRVIKEIRADMVSGQQMNRLLQGDVGSGKTMVAFMSMLLAVDNGYQACIMAPTEILAEQHYATLSKMLDGLPVRVALLTGSIKGKKRQEILEGLVTGDIHLLVGTHAVLEDTVAFSALGFVVIDEQHRFGVAQRAKLWTKNAFSPHVLVMTATPIPRTLAMTLYGDLDVSVIDELPPGRKPIQTMHQY